MGCNPQVKGFQFVDDMTSYGTHRWGWVSDTPGDAIELQVSTPWNLLWTCGRTILLKVVRGAA